MYREHLRRVLDHLKRVLRIEQRLTVEEFYQLLQLSEAVIDYGRMIQSYYERSEPVMIVEVQELALRFRETPRTIENALLLLRDMGRAEPAEPDEPDEPDGYWKLQLAGTLFSGGEGFHVATSQSHSVDDDKGDLGAA